MLLTALHGLLIPNLVDLRHPPICTRWNMEQMNKIKHLRDKKQEHFWEQSRNIVDLVQNRVYQVSD